MNDILRAAPFNLDDAALGWVETTFVRLSLEEKVGQLFVLMSMGDDPTEAERFRTLKPGGITRFFGPDGTAERDRLAALQADADIPLLVSADLEGSRMSLKFGTTVPNPLAIAAIDDLEVTADIARVVAEEARAVGINWSFSPVIDINAAFRSAIVATRGLGSDLETIRRHALKQVEIFQSMGMAATVKHWPGEGHDDRDQHLVTTVNPLSMDEWEATHGSLYRSAIDAGVMSIMSAHIALPAFVRELDPDAGLEAFRPASVSHRLNIELLRKRLGFNGLIVSDASMMGGLGAWTDADLAKPQFIANGCDVILFSQNPAEEMAQVRQAVEDGTITHERLDDAVLRILGLKAALGLHQNRAAAPASFARPDNLAIAERAFHRAPTLVKDVQSLLPLSPDRHKRVLVLTPGIVDPLHGTEPFKLPEMLATEGFEIAFMTPETIVSPDNFDLVLYLFGEETLLGRGRIFLDWIGVSGHLFQSMRRHWHSVPTAMISFGYPYYLYDAPRVPTYINAYSTVDEMQAAVVDLLLGRGQWNENSPVDAFCGLEDARY